MVAYIVYLVISCGEVNLRLPVRSFNQCLSKSEKYNKKKLNAYCEIEKR
jgi:hypothetical protein